jgi:hypothetical protein
VEQRFLAKDDNQVFDRSTSYGDRQLIGSLESQSRVIAFDEETDIKDLRRFKKTGKEWVQESRFPVASRERTVAVVVDGFTF